MGIALVVAILVLSLGIHEAAHGWVALKCGDTTARDMGRITLNPIPHIDPIMTIVVPIALLLMFGFAFGGAKPVPVNFYNLRRPHRDMAIVAMAGPASNLLIAVLIALLLRLFVLDLGLWSSGDQGVSILVAGIYLNLLLAAFNLLPIPPLDGSRVMSWLLPRGLRAAYASLETFGIFIVILLLQVPVVGTQLQATISFLMQFILRIVGFE